MMMLIRFFRGCCESVVNCDVLSKDCSIKLLDVMYNMTRNLIFILLIWFFDLVVELIKFLYGFSCTDFMTMIRF